MRMYSRDGLVCDGITRFRLVSRWHFDVLKFICHFFDQSVSFWMSVCSYVMVCGSSHFSTIELSANRLMLD